MIVQESIYGLPVPQKSDEQTGQQIGIVPLYSNGVSSVTPLLRGLAWHQYQKIRKMRRDPTIALARAVVTSPIVFTPWSIEEKDSPEGAKDLIESVFQPLRLSFLH